MSDEGILLTESGEPIIDEEEFAYLNELKDVRKSKLEIMYHRLANTFIAIRVNNNTTLASLIIRLLGSR